jgi:hypothetical protein
MEKQICQINLFEKLPIPVHTIFYLRVFSTIQIRIFVADG